VALARALAVRPRCLLLDEPLSNLDAKLRQEMRLEIRRICKDHGLTAIYVTHDQKEALSVADRLAVLEDGRIAQVGTPREIYRRPRSGAVAEFVGECNFIGGLLQSVTDGVAKVITDHGRFEGHLSDPDWTPKHGELVMVGVRPESLHLREETQGPNAMDGHVHAATYLGEIAQYELALTDRSHIQVSELNPSQLRACHDRWLHAVASPDDVIVLPLPRES
jgi:ABC-type Fe3+/spermidine/putrescine transport system ATPase subunit